MENMTQLNARSVWSSSVQFLTELMPHKAIWFDSRSPSFFSRSEVPYLLRGVNLFPELVRELSLYSMCYYLRLMFTTIQLKVETRDILKKLGSKGESYDTIINRLIDREATMGHDSSPA